MGDLSRIGIALDSELDRSIAQCGYTNRSEAFRDLIRDRLVSEQTAIPNKIVVETLTLTDDHHSHWVTEKLTEIQRAHHQLRTTIRIRPASTPATSCTAPAILLT